MKTETKEKETDPLDQFEHDPITIAKSQRDRIITRELARLPDEFHANVLQQPLSELSRRVRSAIETFRIDLIDAALNDFAQALRSAAAHERETNPALKPWSAESAIKPWITRLADLHWNGYEISLLTKMLAAVGGETITSGALREVTTDRRTITRDDLRAFADGLRPWDRPDQRAFDANFSSEAAIASAERLAAIAAEKRAHPVFKSGPTSWVTSGKAIPTE